MDSVSRTIKIAFHYRLPVETELKNAPLDENGVAENDDSAPAINNGENDTETKLKKISGDKLQEKLLADSLRAVIAICPKTDSSSR